MAENFQMLKHYSSESLHLKLIGDLDNSAAEEIANSIKNDSKNLSRVFIHTDGLSKIEKYDRSLFENNLNGDFNKPQIIFTGENAVHFPPIGIRIR
jgi:hypothetical protein